MLSLISCGLVAVAALVSRFTSRSNRRPYHMPRWHLPALISVAGLVYAMTQQTHRDLIIVASIFAAGLVYYFAFLKPRSSKYWRISRRTPERAASLSSAAGADGDRAAPEPIGE